MPTPLYRFHCTDGHDLIADRLGKRLPTWALMRAHAERVTLNLMLGAAGTGEPLRIEGSEALFRCNRSTASTAHHVAAHGVVPHHRVPAHPYLDGRGIGLDEARGGGGRGGGDGAG